MIIHPRSFFLSLLLSFAVIIFDQLSKWYLLDVVDISSRSPIAVTSYFNLVMVWNRGVSFGMFAEHNQPLLLIAVALVIVAILLGWLAKSHDRLLTFGIGLVIGGAIGNVIDRARFGAVADFFDFHAFSIHYPAFNIADSAILIGVVVLCIQSIISPEKKS